MSAHGSVRGGRSPSTPGTLTTSITSTRYKLNAKLTSLDPTATRAIPDWLINLKAAAGEDFELAFMSDDQLDNEFRHSTGNDTTSMPDIRATEDLRIMVQAWRDATVRALSKVLYGWIMNNVNWQHDPELARLIRTGDDTYPAFSETKDGRLLFLYLQKRGSRAQPHV